MVERDTETAAAAADAIKVISQAAETATRTVAIAAAEAVKVANISSGVDHDLIVELKTKIEGIKDDIRDLKDGTSARIGILEAEKLNTKDSYPMLYKEGVEKCLNDHENRIRINTERITKIMTWGSAGVLILGVLEFLLSKFF